MGFRVRPPRAIPKGFRAEAGSWAVAQDGSTRVLSQTAKSDDDTFNLALVPDASFGNLDLSVKLKAISGDVDRGGGLVWRARDAKNYYLCRYNPLEENLRVYKVVNGKRTMFRGVKVEEESPGWHSLRIVMSGPTMECSLDGRKLLEVQDATFPDPGMIGVWSKADAITEFDDLRAAEKP